MSGTALSRGILALGLIALSVFPTVGCGVHPKAAAAATPMPAPVAVSVTPNTGTASSAVFQAVYSDRNGATNITADMLINHVDTWAGACGTRYDQAANGLFIINDAGNGWVGPITPGAAGALQNSQCVLNGATSSAAVSGNNLTVTFDVSFLPGFVGEKNIYLLAKNKTTNLESGCTPLGTWSLAISSSFISLPAGKNPEGMAVNPITHKAYVVGEVDDPDRQVVMVFDEAALHGSEPKLIVIPDETEYITVDPLRNRIYLSTRYSLDDEEGGDIDSDAVFHAQATSPTLGTLSVIDGGTDTLIASYQFPESVEPEGVAVDVDRNVIYVGLKAPNPEPANGVCPWGTWFIDRDGEEECWTAGSIAAFNGADIMIGPIKTIPAGDDPESVVFVNNRIYAANEDDGTVTIARAVNPDGSGGELITDTPAYSAALPPYSLGIFHRYGPDTLACPDKVYEADKMAVGWDGSAWSVYITDDKSRLAKIQAAEVAGEATIPGATQCVVTANSDENGLNTANNVSFMQTSSTKPKSAVYVVSEQNTVAILDSKTLTPEATIKIPSAVHMDAIAIDGAAHRVWITDEALMTVFVLQGACANGSGVCEEETITEFAAMTEPPPGSTLTGSTVTFYWTAAPGANAYEVWVGTTSGTQDVDVVSTTGLSATFTNLPVNGIPLFVRLYTLTGGVWHFNEYTYTAATLSTAATASRVAGAKRTSHKLHSARRRPSQPLTNSGRARP
ncbi:MAG TPA: hypothetical protein VFW31_14970 [Candidatus Angelobacter sp.]|nr:hypothetical protein [Candidatus Angelobacter sp.]